MTSVTASAVEILARIASGDVRPSDIVSDSLERLERWQPVTNAFSQVFAKDANASPAPLEAGDVGGAGPLAGVPVAVKDLFDVEGHETTGCSDVYRGNVAARHATVVERVVRAGAVLVGKTNQHELACGATNQVSACGPTFNPWDRARMTGGSSGGSAAAVASGVVPLALGSDTGGSIRIPSSLCGVVGLKPSHGALPVDGMMPLAPSMDCPGPMGRTVEDVAALWRIMRGEDLAGWPLEPATPPLDAAGWGHAVRVGVLGGYFSDRIDERVVEGVAAAADVMGGLGAEVLWLPGELPGDAPAVWTDLAWREFAEHHGSLLTADAGSALLPPTRRVLEHGATLSRSRIEAARAARRAITKWFDACLTRADVLLAPSTPFPAPLAGAEVLEVRRGVVLDVNRGALSVLTRPANLAGVPALSMPSGGTDDGLPLGLQIMAARGREDLVLAVAGALEGSGERFRCAAADGP